MTLGVWYFECRAILIFLLVIVIILRFIIENYTITVYLKNKAPSLVYWNILKCSGTSFFFRTDGSFVVHDVPSGSYVVEVISPAHKFEPVRVDITSKGKMRWAFLDLPLYWSIKYAWQHSIWSNVNSIADLMLHFRPYVSAAFKITSKSTFLKIQNLISFFVFYLWP